MEKEDEFLFNFFTYISQLCFDKAKEHAEKEKVPKAPTSPKTMFLNFLQQLALAEKSYMDLGFLQNKQKSFLRKDNSLRSVYETMKNDLKKIEDGCKNSYQELQNYCQNIMQFLNARVNLIDLYEKVYNLAMGNKHIVYIDILNVIETIIQNNHFGFTNICLTPVKTVFSFECEVLQQLFKAMYELNRLQFLLSLALIHGAHTTLGAWESRMQRETWKLGLFKNSPLPALFLWLQKLKGSVLSKFSLYFHDILANQTAPNDMRHLCSKLQNDYYQKMVSFQKKFEAACVILLSDNKVNEDIDDYDSFPIIVSYPPRSPKQLDTILKMISETTELLNLNRPITKFRSQDQCTYFLSMVEPNIYFVILFESKKSEKDTSIGNFINDFCTNLRCTKIFVSLKNPVK
ncbi:KICSTOR complex protein C12orf66-like [Sitophilus oryzae]|uniref:KICSTOR complex protein C12orf66-like n=1 Tax=Sitophilus oryzae TaxID=7048 RepID=A0A6J2X3Q9_SITOR|nr:KICSTOR complex protein C12orf66-like [Sitophilus oryzae]